MIKKLYKATCKKEYTKLNSLGNYFTYYKNEEYNYEILDLDYFCLLFYCVIEKDVHIRIYRLEFKEYFYTEKELRKDKLIKIYETK